MIYSGCNGIVLNVGGLTPLEIELGRRAKVTVQITGPRYSGEVVECWEYDLEPVSQMKSFSSGFMCNPYLIEI